MLGNQEILDKLYEQAVLFNACVQNKQWEKAKIYYDRAVNVAEFVGLEETYRRDLFGYLDENDNHVPGRFRQDDVTKVYDEYRFRQAL